jgi:phosphoribosylamine---glycine ligase
MKVMVIGGGGREHALVWKLSQSRQVDALFCVPGNGGISEIAECVELDVNDVERLAAFSKREGVDLVIVGPENPLAAGITDTFEKEGIPIFGPRKNGAFVETSKIFAKELMQRHNIPTASFKVFSSHADAEQYIRGIVPPYVIKADGLCAGKGAYVIREGLEGEGVLRDVMINRVHGNAGERIVVETFLSGVEASYLAFTDGKSILPLLPSQDHKPLLDDDKGPNTGGMGAYTPIPFVDGPMESDIDERIMKRTIDALRSEGVTYKGVLYGGLMIMDSVPYVIEFNARLGDPETQPILFKMESDILPIVTACVEENLNAVNGIQWKPGVSVCVVLVSGGYPEKPEKGKKIRGLEDLKNRPDVMVFHAGTKKIGNEFYTSGGRVLGVTAIGDSYGDAIRKVYDAIGCINFEGMHYRKDIGKKAIAFQLKGGGNE